jgi:hypothetical protein
VGGLDFAALRLTIYKQNTEARRQPEVSAKSRTEPRVLLTSGPVGSFSRSHKDRSLRGDRVSTALRARVAAYSRRRGLESIRYLASAVTTQESRCVNFAKNLKLLLAIACYQILSQNC